MCVYTCRSEDNSRESVPGIELRSSDLATSAYPRSATSEAPKATFNCLSFLRPLPSPRVTCPPAASRPGMAGEGGARAARPSHGPPDAAGRSVIRARVRTLGTPEGQVPSASGGGVAWRHGAPGPEHRLRGKQKPRAGGRVGAALRDR